MQDCVYVVCVCVCLYICVYVCIVDKSINILGIETLRSRGICCTPIRELPPAVDGT